MRKLIYVLVALSLIATPLITEAAEITFQIPDSKLPRIVNAMEGIFEIPDEDGDGAPDFTPNQWAKECVRRWIISTVRRWEVSEVMKAASAAVQSDNSLVQ